MTPEERSRFDAAYAVMRLAFDVGEKIRDARERAGLSQRELATRMGTSQATVVRLEAGSGSVTLTTLRKWRPHSTSRSQSNSQQRVSRRTYENKVENIGLVLKGLLRSPAVTSGRPASHERRRSRLPTDTP